MTILYLGGTALLLLLILCIIIYAFLHQKKVIQLRTQLHEEELRRQRAVFNALEEGEEKERTRLAQELHDGVGAKLSGLKMNLEYLKSNSRENTDLLSKIFMGLSETLEEVRAISHNLQPYFNEKSLEQLLLHHMELLNISGNCRYDLYTNGEASGMGSLAKRHSYRIIEELLNNINKHAQATIASVQLSMEADKIGIVVEDNGIGIDQARNNAEGIGLKNINNRVNICKGIMNMDSSAQGTSVMIEIPLNPNV